MSDAREGILSCFRRSHFSWTATALLSSKQRLLSDDSCFQRSLSSAASSKKIVSMIRIGSKYTFWDHIQIQLSQMKYAVFQISIQIQIRFKNSPTNTLQSINQIRFKYIAPVSVLVQVGGSLSLNVLFKVHSLNLPYNVKIMAYRFGRTHSRILSATCPLLALPQV